MTTKWYLVGGVFLASLAMNTYQFYQIQKFDSFEKIMVQKDKLLSDGYNDIALSYLEKIKNNQDDILKNQGRLEGILAVVHNFSPDENLHSAVWHDGYNRGEDNLNYAFETAFNEGFNKALDTVSDTNNKSSDYEDGYHKALEDMYCPANIKSYAKEPIKDDKQLTNVKE